MAEHVDNKDKVYYYQKRNVYEKRKVALKKEKRRASGGKIAAIVLASLAGLLVLAAVGVWGFLRYTNSLHAGMFADRSSSTMQQIRQQREAAATPAPEAGQTDSEQESAPMADWVDTDGSAYRYRDDVQTLLIMGIDNMTDPANWAPGVVSNGGNADVLALVILDGAAGRVSILYIPRDTMTNMLQLDAEGNYLDTVFNNISASHSYGDGGALSCELTADAVSNLLYGVPILRYAAMDFESMSAINQALGGLEITFPEDYSKLDYAFQQGATVRLTDYQLNRLIRYRDHSELDGAYQRGLRDLKLVLDAMLRQVKQMLREDPGAAMSIYNQLKPYMTTNLSLDEISYLAQQVTGFSIDADTIVHMPGVVTAGEKYAEFYPDEEWLHSYVIETFCEKIN